MFIYVLLAIIVHSHCKDVCYYAKFDLENVLDVTTSIDPSEFLQLKGFLHDLCDRLHIAKNYIRIGIVKFSATGWERVDLRFEDGTDKDWILEYTDPDNVNGLQQFARRDLGVDRRSSRRGTDLAPGLGLAFHEMFEDNDRGGDKLSIILTDGQTMYPDQDSQQADRIKDEGGKIFTIGVGLTTLSKEHLKSLASEPDYFFDATSFSDLDDFVDKIADAFPCGVHPFIQFLIILPFLFLLCYCLYCLLALCGGLALLFLGAFKHKPKKEEGLLDPIPPPILDDIVPLPMTKAVPIVAPPKGGETTESMYYVGGQQTAVNWGKGGIHWDTAFRPGDMGMGDEFGSKVGANYAKLNEDGKEKLIKKKDKPPKYERFDEEEDLIEKNMDRYTRKYEKKRKWCFLL